MILNAIFPFQNLLLKYNTAIADINTKIELRRIFVVKYQEKSVVIKFP